MRRMKHNMGGVELHVDGNNDRFVNMLFDGELVLHGKIASLPTNAEVLVAGAAGDPAGRLFKSADVGEMLFFERDPEKLPEEDECADGATHMTADVKNRWEKRDISEEDREKLTRELPKYLERICSSFQAVTTETDDRGRARVVGHRMFRPPSGTTKKAASMQRKTGEWRPGRGRGRRGPTGKRGGAREGFRGMYPPLALSPRAQQLVEEGHLTEAEIEAEKHFDGLKVDLMAMK